MSRKERTHVAFLMPPELRERAEAVLLKVREDSTPRAHASELAELIVELTRTGLHAYFLAPLERIEVGPMALRSAKVGVATAGRGLPMLVRRVVGKMTDAQLHKLVEVMDEMIV